MTPKKPGQKKTYIQFKVMFDEFCPGLYEILYMPWSSLAHGGAALIYRMKQTEDGRFDIRHMNTPDTGIRDAVIAPFIYLVHAFLLHAPRLIGVVAIAPIDKAFSTITGAIE